MKRIVCDHAWRRASSTELVTDVSVMPAVHTMVEGDIFYYSGIVEPDDADEKALTWTSSDPTVIEIGRASCRERV